MSFETTVPAPTPSRRLNRRLAVVGSVLGFHVLAVWALQSGLLRRAVELVIPVEVMAELIEPPQPQVAPETAGPGAARASRRRPSRARPRRRRARCQWPRPRPPAPIRPPLEPVVPAPPAPVVAAPPPAPPAPPAPAPVVTPPPARRTTSATPSPPTLAVRRMGEQGQVLVRAFVDTKGMPSRVEVARSSGFERLDKTAVDTVLRWRFVPGKRGGEPVAMWVEVPIVFELNFSN